MREEKSYLTILKETTMLNTHVGSGPKDPAAKEKETKSPVEDSKGQGTEQAGTKSPNTIPAVASLKKMLALEGYDVSDEQAMEVLEDASMIAQFAQARKLKKGVKKRALERGLSPKAATAQANAVVRRSVASVTAKKHGFTKSDVRNVQRFNVKNARELGLARSPAYKRKLAKEKENK